MFSKFEWLVKSDTKMTYIVTIEVEYISGCIYLLTVSSILDNKCYVRITLKLDVKLME